MPKIKEMVLDSLQQMFPPLKPSAICIGAQKAGTTALYDYLSYHHSVAPSKVKEIDFFNCNSRFFRGERFYHSHFPRRTPKNYKKHTFDITPGYLSGAEKTAKRIYEYNRNIRILVLLRNPIDRAYSAWQMYRKRYFENKEWFFEWVKRCDATIQMDHLVKRPSTFGQTFQEDIANEIEALKCFKNIEMPILLLGMYYRHIKHFYNHFSRDQILVISSEDMKQDTKRELRKIESFVGLNPHSWTTEELLPRFVGMYNDSISPNDYLSLKTFYKEHNRALFGLLQKEFEWG
jgi:hypothetical protein